MNCKLFKTTAGLGCRLVWGLAMAVVIMAGCGPQIPPCYPVKGTVVWRGGKSFKAGSITFQSKSDQEIVAIGNIDKDGSFTVSTKMFGESKDGAPEGEYTVMVEDPSKNVASDGQMQIKPMVVTTATFKVEPKPMNEFKVEVVQ